MSESEGNKWEQFERDMAERAKRSEAVFSRLTPEERATRIAAATGRLEEMELEAIANGNMLPADLPQPDTFGVWIDTPGIYFPEGWEDLEE